MALLFLIAIRTPTRQQRETQLLILWINLFILNGFQKRSYRAVTKPASALPKSFFSLIF